MADNVGCADCDARRGGVVPYVTEKEFLAQVIQLGRIYQWGCYHTHDSRRSAAGFPDIVMVRLSRILFIELKSERGKVTPVQQEWLDALELTGKVETYLWKPSMWDTVVEVLR